MKILKLAAAAALATSFLAGCGGPEGKYKLDKEAMKKAMEAEIEKKPKEEQGFAKLAVAMIEAMDMELEVKSGGKFTMKSTMPSLGGDKKAEEKTDEGEWTLDGDKITLKGPKDSTTCKVDGKKIECSGKKDGDPGITFIKS